MSQQTRQRIELAMSQQTRQRIELAMSQQTRQRIEVALLFDPKYGDHQGKEIEELT